MVQSIQYEFDARTRKNFWYCPDPDREKKGLDTFCANVEGQPWCVARCGESDCPSGYSCEVVKRYGRSRARRKADRVKGCVP